MSAAVGTKPKSRKANSKARQDVVLKAIPHVVEALTTIVLNSKNDNFKKKCCRMFKVEDLNSIATCMETNLWKITGKKLGILQPKNSKELVLTAPEVYKDDFEDILFFSNTTLVNIPKEIHTRGQFHEGTTNVCCTKPPSNNQNDDCSLSELSPSNENDLLWDLPENNLEFDGREPSFGTCNECSTMSHFSILESHGLYDLQQQDWENKLEKTKEGQSNNLHLKYNSDNELGLNQTLLQIEVKQQGTCSSEKSDSHDGDWLNSYEQDNFWMDNSCIKTSQDSTNNLEKMANTESEKHSVTKGLEKKATSHVGLRKKYGFLYTENPLSKHDDTQQFCKVELNKVELGNDLEVQHLVSYNYNEHLELSNDYNFEQLINFT